MRAQGARAPSCVVERSCGDVEGDAVTVIDRYIDFIVPPRASSPYRIIDLDEFADALVERQVTPNAAAKALRAAQAFVDAYLHRIGAPQGDSWTDFPPQKVRPYLEGNRRMPRGDLAAPRDPPDDWRSVDV
jgi:hypothetical protein